MSIRLHSEHGIAPALTFCRICGKDANEIALLGSQCDTVLKQVHEATNGAHGDKDGYKDYGHNRIPATESCEACQGHLKWHVFALWKGKRGQRIHPGPVQLQKVQ
jgi:hypothetical protein